MHNAGLFTGHVSVPEFWAGIAQPCWDYTFFPIEVWFVLCDGDIWPAPIPLSPGLGLLSTVFQPCRPYLHPLNKSCWERRAPYLDGRPPLSNHCALGRPLRANLNRQNSWHCHVKCSLTSRATGLSVCCFSLPATVNMLRQNQFIRWCVSIKHTPLSWCLWKSAWRTWCVCQFVENTPQQFFSCGVFLIIW